MRHLSVASVVDIPQTMSPLYEGQSENEVYCCCGSFIFSCTKTSLDLIVRLSRYFLTQSPPHLRHLLYRGTSFPIPVVRSLCPLLSTIMLEPSHLAVIFKFVAANVLCQRRKRRMNLLPWSFLMKIEALGSSETSAHNQQTTRTYVPWT
jgi:hypothetical protein